MPGMKPIIGPQGLEFLVNNVHNKNFAQEQNTEITNTLGITAPAIGYHGIGPLG